MSPPVELVVSRTSTSTGLQSWSPSLFFNFDVDPLLSYMYVHGRNSSTHSYFHETLGVRLRGRVALPRYGQVDLFLYGDLLTGRVVRPRLLGGHPRPLHLVQLVGQRLAQGLRVGLLAGVAEPRPPVRRELLVAAANDLLLAQAREDRGTGDGGVCDSDEEPYGGDAGGDDDDICFDARRWSVSWRCGWRESLRSKTHDVQ